MALASDQESPALSRAEVSRPWFAADAMPLGAAVLAALFPEFAPSRGRAPPAAIAVWSDGARVRRARARAAALGVPLWRLGHGLLRAPPWDNRGSPVLSVTAREIEAPEAPGSLALNPPNPELCADRLLSVRGWETPALLQRAAAARRELVAQRVGGAWWHDGGLPQAAALADSYVVIEDAAHIAVADAMLNAALAHSAASKIALVAAAGRLLPPHLAETAAARGCAVAATPIDPWRVIERAQRVYTAGGETGFLALLAGREVCCFGDAFYAGWGVTTDTGTVSQRPLRRSLDEMFAGACLLATRCLEPYHNTAASFEQITAILADWRRIEHANRQVAACVGMSFWKRRRVADFLRSAQGSPVFCRMPQQALAAARARPGQAIAVWASRMPEGLVEAAARQASPLVRVEDGFIRSVGLGSDFMPAASLVLDWNGIYYDPRVSSDLERLLRETEFPPALIARARGLIAGLVGGGVTKYNLGSAAPALEIPAGRRRFLVPGQVEDDLSVRFGAPGIRGNLDLLARVRAANPDAFIVYKPHPDVEAGHRKGAVPDRAAAEFADSIVRGVSTAALLDEVDEVHTLTSLTGFEALLRRRRVVAYGRPFYAGWGLTADLAPVDRGRELALEELVAGALILYPRYLDPVTRLPCPPELVVERLRCPELWRPSLLVTARRLQGMAVRRFNALAPARGRGERA
jgi:capsular polysaccharide export protein